MNELLIKLSKESLVFLILIHFDAEEVKSFEEYESGIRFEMKDGRTINAKK